MGYKEENQNQRLYTSKDLARLTTKAREGMTQEEVADRLGVTKQSISKAENEETGSRMNRLRIRIIEEIGDYKVSGPYWTIEE